MKYRLVWLLFASFFMLTAFMPRKTIYVPNQVVTLNVQDNLFVVGEQREGTKKTGFYSFYTNNGIPIGLGTLQGLGDTSISLTCGKEMGWGMAIGGTFLSGNNRQKGIYVAAKWGTPGKELDKSMIKVYLPEIESVLAIGESRGMPVLLGKRDNNLYLMTAKARQNKIEFEGMFVLPNWSSISGAKWLNEEVFVVAGKNQDGGLRVAKFNAKGEIEADVNPKIDCQGKIKITQQNTKTGYHYVIPALENEREPVCKPSEDGILEIKDLALAFNNDLVLVGNYQSDISSDSDAWFARLSGDLETVLYEGLPKGKFGSGGDDNLFAIDLDPNNGDWLLTGITYSNRYGQRSPDLQVWRVAGSAVTPGKQVYQFPNQQQARDDKGIVFTETLDNRSEEGKCMILSSTLLMFYPASEEIGVTQWPLNIGNTSVPKANAKGESHPDLNFKDIFFDDTDTNANTNSVLEEDESAFISVSATRSNLNNYKDIKFVLTAESDKGSITCGTQSFTLKEGKKQDRFRIPVNAGKVRDGEVIFTIKCNGERIKTLPVITKGRPVVKIKPKQVQETVEDLSKKTDSNVRIKTSIEVDQYRTYKAIFVTKNKNSATPKPSARDTLSILPKNINGNLILDVSFDIPRTTDYFEEGENDVLINIIDPSGEITPFESKLIISINKPHFYGYFFGVPDKKLNYSEKDAKDFANACKKMKGDSTIFSENSIFLHADSSNTTKAQMEYAFYKINSEHKNSNEKATILIYISTHGKLENGELYIKTSNNDPNIYTNNWISFQNIIDDHLKPLENKEVILILDVCYSGNATIKGALDTGIQSVQLHRKGILLLASSGAAPSYECPPCENGIFTCVLLEAIKGAADENHDGKINIVETNNYLRKRVPAIASGEKCQKEQIPTIKCNFENKGDCPDLNIFSVIKP